jgi:hypothetical protein
MCSERRFNTETLPVSWWQLVISFYPSAVSSTRFLLMPGKEYENLLAKGGVAQGGGDGTMTEEGA